MGILPHMEFYCTPLTFVCQWIFSFIPSNFRVFFLFSASCIILPCPIPKRNGIFCAIGEINDRLAYQSLPLGEGGPAQAGSDEGKPGSKKIAAVKAFGPGLTLISQKSKIFASFPQGKPLGAPAPVPLTKINDNLAQTLPEHAKTAPRTGSGCSFTFYYSAL